METVTGDQLVQGVSGIVGHWMSLYNKVEHDRWSKEFERTIDRMCIISDENPIWDDEKCCPPPSNAVSFFVRVVNQPDDVTETVKKHTNGKIPEGYNNVACYYKTMGRWGLKFNCCQ